MANKKLSALNNNSTSAGLFVKYRSAVQSPRVAYVEIPDCK